VEGRVAMSRLERVKKFTLRLFSSISFLALFSLVLGGLISIPLIPRPNIATITISGLILEQAYTDDILEMLGYARDSANIKAVVLKIDSPGGYASTIEQIYMEVLQLKQHKPVVALIGARGASGGYYIAVASNFIYAQPSSQLGNIGAWSSLPTPEELDEDIITTGPFKSTGGSRRKAISGLETLRQQFVEAVVLQRGDRLKLSEEELSRAEVYSGVESLRYGLIDDIGTATIAVEKAADLAHIRNYKVVDLYIPEPTFWLFGSVDMEALKSRTGLMPVYYYLYFESR